MSPTSIFSGVPLFVRRQSREDESDPSSWLWPDLRSWTHRWACLRSGGRPCLSSSSASISFFVYMFGRPFVFPWQYTENHGLGCTKRRSYVDSTETILRSGPAIGSLGLGVKKKHTMEIPAVAVSQFPSTYFTPKKPAIFGCLNKNGTLNSYVFRYTYITAYYSMSSLIYNPKETG